MATVTTDKLIWGPVSGVICYEEGSAHNLNDADNSIAGIILLAKSGTITKVGIWVKAITGNPPAYNIGIVTVDATNNSPTSTAYGGATNPTYDFTATGWVWVDLTVAATAVAGNCVAVRVWPTASAPDGSNYIATCQQFSTPSSNQRVPHGRYFTTGWLNGNGMPPLGIMYSDGTVALPSMSACAVAFQSDTDPDEYGAAFTLPFAATCIGAAVGMVPKSTAVDATVTLYQGTTALASTALDTTQLGTSVGMGPSTWVPFAPQTLLADTTYRIAVTNSSAASDLSLGYVTVNEAASRYFWPEGRRWQGTTRVDAGAWTDNPLRLPMMGLILSDITLPDPGGGTTTIVRRGSPRLPAGVPLLG